MRYEQILDKIRQDVVAEDLKETGGHLELWHQPFADEKYIYVEDSNALELEKFSLQVASVEYDEDSYESLNIEVEFWDYNIETLADLVRLYAESGQYHSFNFDLSKEDLRGIDKHEEFIYSPSEFAEYLNDLKAVGAEVEDYEEDYAKLNDDEEVILNGTDSTLLNFK